MHAAQARQSVLRRAPACRSAATWRCAVLGDLHLAPDQMQDLFHPARSQLVHHASAGAAAARVVQLGDLGHGKHRSGSRACFEYAR